jgi:bacterioferritin
MKEQHRQLIMEMLTAAYWMELETVTNSNSVDLDGVRNSLEPPADSTEVVAVIRGVIEAEEAAIAHHNKLIDLCGEAHDCVTRDLSITHLADEEGDRVMFTGFLKAYARS